MKVGVVLPQPREDMGEWLADAAAFDAAGVDVLWIDPLPDAGLDPLAVAAALATLTFRALLVAAVPESYGSPQARGRTLATLVRLSRGRFALCGERARLAEIAGAAVPEVFCRIDAGTYARTRGGVELDQWVRAAPPAGREPWRAAVADATERAVGGLLVPAESRLLDILRNPDDPGDRHDLHLATG